MARKGVTIAAPTQNGAKTLEDPLKQAPGSLEQRVFTLQYINNDVEDLYLQETSSSRRPVIASILIFDVAALVFRSLARSFTGVQTPQALVQSIILKLCSIIIMYSAVIFISTRSSRLGKAATRLEELLLSVVIAAFLTVLIAGIGPGFSGDPSNGALFLVATTSILRVRWFVGSSALLIPVIYTVLCGGGFHHALFSSKTTAAAATTTTLRAEDVALVVAAWAVGGLMSYLSDVSRRQAYSHHQQAMAAVSKEFTQVRARLDLERKLVIAQAQASAKAATISQERAAGEAKSQLMGLLCHEVRTPLNGCLASAEMLLETNLTEEQLELARTIRISGSILLSTVSSFLDFFKLEAGHQLDVVKSPINIYELVADVHCIIEAMMVPKSLKNSSGVELLHPELENVPDLVVGDPNRIAGILLNLYSNAAKYTKRGCVSLKVQVVKAGFRPKPDTVASFFEKVLGKDSFIGDEPINIMNAASAVAVAAREEEERSVVGLHQTYQSASKANVLAHDHQYTTHAALLVSSSSPYKVAKEDRQSEHDSAQSLPAARGGGGGGVGGTVAVKTPSELELDDSSDTDQSHSEDRSTHYYHHHQGQTTSYQTSISGSSGSSDNYMTKMRQLKGGMTAMSCVDEGDGWYGAFTQSSADSCNSYSSAGSGMEAEEEEEEEEQIQIQHQQQWLVFQVMDTGVGVSSAALSSLFEDFIQGSVSEVGRRRTQGSTGLGLSICAKQVAVLQGTLGALSKPGRGSVFWFAIPLNDDDDDMPSPSLYPSPQLRMPVDENDEIETDSGGGGGDDVGAIKPLKQTRSIDSLGQLDISMNTLSKGNTVSSMKREYSSSSLIEDDANDILTVRWAGPPCGRTAGGGDDASTSTSCQQQQEQQQPMPVPSWRKSVDGRPSIALKNLHILLAEDDVINRAVAQKVLQALGATCSIACDGAEAVEHIRLGEEKFDAILMDMCMPVLNGVAAARAIRDLGCNIPIIAMTANASDKDKNECIQAGMDAFLTKPVLKEQLTRTILEVLMTAAAAAAGAE
jgi:signal transduction histidine kinase/CheY-like chemotaxis protein